MNYCTYFLSFGRQYFGEDDTCALYVIMARFQRETCAVIRSSHGGYLRNSSICHRPGPVQGRSVLAILVGSVEYQNG
jgi:hypothetical protein